MENASFSYSPNAAIRTWGTSSSRQTAEHGRQMLEHASRVGLNGQEDDVFTALDGLCEHFLELGQLAGRPVHVDLACLVESDRDLALRHANWLFGGARLHSRPCFRRTGLRQEFLLDRSFHLRALLFDKPTCFFHLPHSHLAFGDRVGPMRFGSGKRKRHRAGHGQSDQET